MHVTMKYKKKLRLLVTNQCSRNCLYCHNEGMRKSPTHHLVPSLLVPFLPDIKRYTNRVVISGGEPFEYPFLEKLVELLSSYGFDLTLLSANVDEGLLYKLGDQLKNLHYSIHALEHLNADACVIRRIKQQLPSLNLALNVPFSSMDDIQDNWESLYRMAREVGANIQLIKLFTPGSKLLASSSWEERWREVQQFLAPFSSFMEATERETRYVTNDYIKIDLLDIPCQASGREFRDGSCLSNSDLTIDPELCVSICRWGEHRSPLYNGNVPRSFDKAVLEATEKACDNCSFGEIGNFLQSATVNYYRNAPHYTWPRAGLSIEELFSKISFRDLSYYGRSGFVARLESAFCKDLGSSFALAVNSGTAAVFLAILSLGLQPSDEIIMPVATFPSLVGAARLAGVKVRLCDIDPITGNLLPESLQQSISPQSKAVLITHLWGCPAEMDKIVHICQQYRLYTIEDCSHAYGATYNGQRVGTLGDIACFSMQANKAVYAGEGGMLVTNNRAFYEKAVLYSSSVERVHDCVHAPDNLQYWGTGLGIKLKINPLGAVLAQHALDDLKSVNQEREIRIQLLSSAAKKSGIFLSDIPQDSNANRVHYTYKLVLKEPYIHLRDSLLHKLIHDGLDATETSFIPVYKHTLAAEPFVINGADSFPNADKYYRRIISLPAFVHEPLDLIRFYADTIQSLGMIANAEQASIDEA